jgi:hypothetical protein
MPEQPNICAIIDELQDSPTTVRVETHTIGAMKIMYRKLKKCLSGPPWFSRSLLLLPEREIAIVSKPSCKRVPTEAQQARRPATNSSLTSVRPAASLRCFFN